MTKALTLLSMTLLLLSCSEGNELISFPAGDYVSICTISGSDSKNSEITIARDFKSQTIQTFVYSGVSNCTGIGTPESDPVTNEIRIIFSNENLGQGFSYLTTTFEFEGEEQVEFIAFKFENSRLYFSLAATSLGEDPKVTFADFISDPDFTADLILTRKDLNRPLSKN